MEMITGAVIAGLFTLVGMLLSGVFNWINNQNALDASSESQTLTEAGLDARLEKRINAAVEKINSKLDKQYELKWRSDWQLRLHECLSEFIIITDPDLVIKNYDRAEIVSLIHKTTILLNNQVIESHGKLNGAILEYGMYLTGYEGTGFDHRYAMTLHENLVLAAKEVLYVPSPS